MENRCTDASDTSIEGQLTISQREKCQTSEPTRYIEDSYGDSPSILRGGLSCLRDNLTTPCSPCSDWACVNRVSSSTREP